MHALIEMWTADEDQDTEPAAHEPPCNCYVCEDRPCGVWTSEATAEPLSVATRALQLEPNLVGMNAYVYDEAEECVARWHWRATDAHAGR